MSQNDAKAAIPQLQEAHASTARLTKTAQRELQAQITVVNNKRAAVRRLQMCSATSANQREELKLLWADLMLRRGQREQKIDTAELERAKSSISKLTLEL